MDICFITDASPKDLLVTLSNGAYSSHSTKAGRYVKQAGVTNGRSFWMKGDDAIWYNDRGKNWIIGLREK